MKKTIYQVSALLFGFAFVLAAFGLVNTNSPVANAVAQETCPDTDSNSGWVKVEGLSSLTYTYTVPSGYTVVENCYKASTTVVYGGASNTVTSTVFNSPGQGVTCTAPGVPHEGCSYQNLSHASFRLVKDEKKTYTFEFEKAWTGDEIDLDGVEVTFNIGEIEWKLGDEPVEVEPGEVLEPLSETVTGLPGNCTYESDLPESYQVFSEYVAARIVAVEVPMTDTLVVTNDVTCEDEEEETPQVLADVDEPQVVAPVGAVNAGAGSTNTVVASVVGLVGSLSAVGYGVVRFVKGE